MVSASFMYAFPMPPENQADQAPRHRFGRPGVWAGSGAESSQEHGGDAVCMGAAREPPLLCTIATMQKPCMFRVYYLCVRSVSLRGYNGNNGPIRGRGDKPRMLSRSGHADSYRTPDVSNRLRQACHNHLRIRERIDAMKPLLPAALLVTVVGASAQVSLQFQTHSFPVDINKRTTPRAEVAAALDTRNRTHIAWVKDRPDVTGTITSIMYSRYADGEVTTSVVDDITTTNRYKSAPAIVTDANDNPHIVYFVIRDRDDGGTQSGNFAVMYAGDPDGDGAFELSQVSTNVEDPSANPQDIYSCYVSGRPRISMGADGNVYVNYMSDGIAEFGYDEYIILAHGSADGWQREQAFKPQDNYSVKDRFSMSLRMAPNHEMAYVDIGDYDLRFISRIGGNWVESVISGYAYTFGNDCPQIDLDSYGTVHYTWFHNGDVEKFCHTTISGTSYGDIRETPIEHSEAGNFMPSAVDFVTGDVYHYYDRSWSSRNYFISFDRSGNAVETELTNPGVIYGHRCMNVYNGYVSIVTADADSIYVTTNTGDAGVADGGARGMKLIPCVRSSYPNPARGTTTISYAVPSGAHVRLALYTTAGREVVRLVDGPVRAGAHEAALNAATLRNGTYICRLTTGETTVQRTMTIAR